MSGLIEKDDAAADILACAAYLAEHQTRRGEQAECLMKIARIYAQRDDVDTAALLADVIADPHSRDLMLTEITAQCALIGDDEYAWQLVEAIESKDFQNEARQRIAVAQAARGDFNAADETSRKVDDSSALFADITIRLAKSNAEDAENRLSQIALPIFRAQVLYEIAAAEMRRGDKERAESLLERAAEETRGAQYVEDVVQMLLNIAHLAEQLGAENLSKNCLKQTRAKAADLDPNFREQFLTQIAVGFATVGDFITAENIVHSIGDLHQKSVAAGLIAVEQKTFGKDAEAIEWLEESFQILQSQKPHQIRSTPARTAWHVDLAKNFARCGAFERAFEITALIADIGARDSACREIAVEAVRYGREELAQQAIDAITSAETKLLALVGKAFAENDINEKDKSLNTLHEAEILIDEVKTLGGRLSVLSALTEAFLRFQKPKIAEELWRESLHLLESVNDTRIKSQTLAELAQTQTAAGIALNDEDRTLLAHLAKK